MSRSREQVKLTRRFRHYVSLSFGRHQAKTSVVKDQQDPQWNELFGFHVSPLQFSELEAAGVPFDEVEKALSIHVMVFHNNKASPTILLQLVFLIPYTITRCCSIHRWAQWTSKSATFRAILNNVSVRLLASVRFLRSLVSCRALLPAARRGWTW